MTDFVFKKKVETQLGMPVFVLVGAEPIKGDIGIEIEVEGNKFQKKDIPTPWKYTKDGSLRGQDNAEYVLKGPISFEKVNDAIDILWDMFKKYGSKLDESNRTSVHVHLNVQKFHLNRLCSFFALYFIIEELLTAWCGDHRVGNLFCLRSKDAPAIVSEIKNMLVNEKVYFTEGMHYANVNAQALNKFGSVEIRSLRGCTDPQNIIDWVSVLERIYKLSAEFPDPRAIPEGFSGGGPLSFLENILGDKFHLIIDNIGYTNNEISDALYSGIRLAQDLCYCRDWSEYTPRNIKDDPFGRSKKTISQKLTNSPGSIVAATALSSQLDVEVTQNPFQVYGPVTTTFEIEPEEDENDEDYDYVDIDEIYEDED